MRDDLVAVGSGKGSAQSGGPLIWKPSGRGSGGAGNEHVFLVPRAAGLKKFKEEEAFVVRHFAGNVCYMSAGFLEKNKDTLYSDLVTLMRRACNGNATAA